MMRINSYVFENYLSILDIVLPSFRNLIVKNSVFDFMRFHNKYNRIIELCL